MIYQMVADNGFPQFLVAVDPIPPMFVRTDDTETKSYVADFTIYPVAGVEDDGTILYEIQGGMTSMDLTHDLAYAETIARGSVKWDGCANFTVDTPGVMLHVCNRDGMTFIGQALLLAYDIAFAELEEL
jgi:hypothetical protein